MRAWMLLLALGALAGRALPAGEPGETRILKWPQGKTGAVSITYDDGTRNQFRVALPLMQRLGLPATFFVVTGEVRGAKHKQRFVGRLFAEVAAEAAQAPTTAANILERVPALWSSGYEGMGPAHLAIGGAHAAGKLSEAARLVDETFAKIRRGELKPLHAPNDPAIQEAGTLTWDLLRKVVEDGYEVASHSVSHPYLCALDDANLAYELEKSREEIARELGPRMAFSVECPFGIEDPRAVGRALELYPLSRNAMPDPFVQDLNRWDEREPGKIDKEYVRWQRGMHPDTTRREEWRWLDKTGESDKVWLALVIHGVDGIGWHPIPSAELEAFFSELKDRTRLWVATFQDVGKYIRERQHSSVNARLSGKTLRVKLTHNLEPAHYDLPLTLSTRVPEGWTRVQVEQGTTALQVDVKDGVAVYTAVPNGPELRLRKVRL